jgi:hypothetical protein
MIYRGDGDGYGGVDYSLVIQSSAALIIHSPVMQPPRPHHILSRRILIILQPYEVENKMRIHPEMITG